MAYNKLRRKAKDPAIINQRFSKGLVMRQLSSLIEYGYVTSALLSDLDRVQTAWAATHKDPTLRPRYFDVMNIVGFNKPTMILVSDYSTMMIDDIVFENVKLTYRNETYYGLPITDMMVQLIGGTHIVARVLLVGGVKMMLDMVKDKANMFTEFELVKFNACIKVWDDYVIRETRVIIGD